MEELESTGEPPMVFTFFSEKEGSTLIEQFLGRDLREALVDWYRGSIVKPEAPFDEDDEPARVTAVKNVWCISGHDVDGKFYLTHIVATVPRRIDFQPFISEKGEVASKRERVGFRFFRLSKDQVDEITKLHPKAGIRPARGSSGDYVVSWWLQETETYDWLIDFLAEAELAHEDYGLFVSLRTDFD